MNWDGWEWANLIHYIYYCGQESLEKKWSGHHSQQKSSKYSAWVQPQKQQSDLGSFLRQTIQHHSNPSLHPATDAEEAKVDQLYEDL